MINDLGIKTVQLSDEEVSNFYLNPEDNTKFLCNTNEYLVIKTNNELLSPYYWCGTRFKEVPYLKFESSMLGCIKPKGKDPYQMAYMDSLTRNQLTIATGPQGSGKSLIALSYAFQELEKGTYSKMIIFANPWIANSAVKLGFMPGSKIDKLLETSIGSILISKLGGRQHVERLIDKEEIILMPMGDCRGYEVPQNSFVYFTEAQNTDRYLMKLFLQRTNDECKICIEGDERQQDSEKFHNGLNGLQRVIDVFKGEPYAGHIKLQNIYRGIIAKKAEEI